jgi:hypothetical protein
VTLQQFSSYCQTAVPILGMIYTAILIYEARSSRWNMLKQVFAFSLFAVLAYARLFGT